MKKKHLNGGSGEGLFGESPGMFAGDEQTGEERQGTYTTDLHRLGAAFRKTHKTSVDIH